MVQPAYEAHLRVFVPLSTLSSGERRRWERYLAAGRAPDRAGLARAEHQAGLTAAIRPSLDVDEEHALVDVEDGITYICPARTQLRVWQASQTFREGLPDLLADAFIPRALADEAADQLAGLQEVSPGLLAHVRSSAWTVPLPWFLLFETGDRVEGEQGMRYVTPMSAARRRAARALQVVRRTIPDGNAVDDIEDLGRWLEEFHPHARVELDYGELAALLAAEQSEADTCVADLADGLAALRRGDGEGAGAAYTKVTSFWRPLSLRENAS